MNELINNNFDIDVNIPFKKLKSCELNINEIKSNLNCYSNETFNLFNEVTNGNEKRLKNNDSLKVEELSDTYNINVNEKDENKSSSISDETIVEPQIDLNSYFIEKEKNYFANDTLVELSLQSWLKTNQYLRGCIWSPDGTCILSVVNGDGMHVTELSKELYTATEIASDRPLDLLESAVHVEETGTVYNIQWFPHMNSTIPETCCWLASRQHEPIHLWDAFDGQLRCSYKGYNAVDEVEAAYTVGFSLDGLQIYAGYKKAFKIFQTDRPGRQCINIPLKCTISCLATNPVQQSMIALGSWNNTLTLYDIMGKQLADIETLQAHTNGITFAKFTNDGTALITGARKDCQLCYWDLRNLSKPYHIFERKVDTNQRVYFDISTSGKWLASGDTSGLVHIWDINDIANNKNIKELKFPLHKDCCNGVSLHPSLSILATGSGQYHHDPHELMIEPPVDTNEENSLSFWWCGKLKIND